MRIEKLSLTNFRSHERTDIEFAPVTFILGPNGAGKSSIAMAIEYLLTGICDVTDEGGKGAEDLIHGGAAELGVGALILTETDRVKIGRSRNRSHQSSLAIEKNGGAQVSGPPAREWMQKHLAPAQVLSAVLNASRFIDLDQAAQKRLLSQVLADQGVPYPKELHGALVSLSSTDFPEFLTIAQLDTIYKAAYERRTQLGRDLKALGNLAAPETLEPPSVEEIKAKLEALKHERDQVISEKAKRLEGLEYKKDDRSKITVRIAEIEAFILPMKEEKGLKAATEKAAGLETAQTLARNVQASIQARKADLASLAKLGSKSVCPTCQQQLSKKTMEEISGVLQGNITHMEGQLERAQSAIKACVEANELCERIKCSIAAVAEKEDLEAKLAALPEDGAAPDTTDLDATIAQLDSRISKGQDVLVKASALKEQIKQYNEATGKRARIDDELGLVEKVLGFAGPDGARKEAAGGKIDSFNAAMNTALEPFGFNALLSVEPYRMQVLTGHAERKALDVGLLSESERFRFSVAFQIALAQVTGIGVVVIDRADVLDRETRRNLVAMVMGSGIQVIVCSTSTDSLPESAPAGVKFYQLAQDHGATRIADESPAKAVAA